MPSLYLKHRITDLPADPTTTIHEGTVFPLLRRVGTDVTLGNWAYAVPKPTTGDEASRRKNRLACSVLRAIAFEYDDEFNGFDPFYLPVLLSSAEALMDSIPRNTFDATFPVANGAAAGVDDPVGGTLMLAADYQVVKINWPATFAVEPFTYSENAADLGHRLGFFSLGTAGNPTNPFMELSIEIPEANQQGRFPVGFKPRMTFHQAGTTGILRFDAVPFEPNNLAIPLGPGGSSIELDNDVRDDRLMTATATLTCETLTSAATPHVAQSLAIQVFPSFTFQPDPNVPITVTLGHHGVGVRFFPGRLPELRMNHFKPCLRVVIQSPFIHADVEASGALDAIRLIEPGERRIEETVEQLNDFMTYSFDVCFPHGRLEEITVAELGWLEGLKVTLSNWPDFPTLPELRNFFSKFDSSLIFPNVAIGPLFYTVDLEQLGVTFGDFKTQLGLGDLELKRVFQLRVNDVLQILDITNFDDLGFEFRVNFGTAIDLHAHLDFRPVLESFDFQFPDLGLPALNQFELQLKQPYTSPILEVDLTDLPLLLSADVSAAPDLHLWKIALKIPNQPLVRLSPQPQALCRDRVMFNKKQPYRSTRRSGGVRCERNL